MVKEGDRCAGKFVSAAIYGSFDGGVRRLSNVNAAGDDRVTVGSTGTSMSNRIGFRGMEDLGGGYNAHFTLESGFNTGTGALDAANTLFNRKPRRSTRPASTPGWAPNMRFRPP